MSYGEAEMYLVVGLAVILGLIALRVAPASPEVVGLSHANRKADYGGLASAAAVGGAQDYAAHEAQSGRIYFGGASKIPPAMKNSTHRRRGGATRVAISAGAAIDGKSDRRSAHGA